MKSVYLLGAAAAALSILAISALPAQPPARAAIGQWGFDPASMKRSVRPGDDFFNFANGAWMDRNPIPDDRSTWGSFTRLAEQSLTRVRALLEEAAASGSSADPLQRKIGDLYASYMDEAGIEAKGVAPLRPWLAEIDSVRDVRGLSALFGRPEFPGPFEIEINLDSKDTSRNLLNLGQDGLGLPDRDYYLQAKFADTQARYRAHIAAMFRLAGIADGEARAARIYALERAIAEASWSGEEARDSIKTYNLTDVSALPAVAPGMDWPAYFAALGTRTAQVNLQEKSAIARISGLVASQPLQAWKDWLSFQTISAQANRLPRAFGDENFSFFSKTVYGQSVIAPRWKRAAQHVSAVAGEAVGQLYVQRHFPADSKRRMQELVDNLKSAFRARVPGIEWMSEPTKARALEKLSTFGTKIGYPDRWRDYEKLRIVRGDVIGNAMRAAVFENAHDMSQLEGPVDRGRWLLSPQTVNAYYWPEMNEIVFPAAILDAPFFDPAADPAINYGAIGTVIGHEITHGYDDQGRLQDSKGLLNTWWTADDDRKFGERARRISALYSSFEALPGFNVKGDLTLGENIADLGGVLIAYDAYKLSLGGREAPVIDGLTGDQRFFLGFAQAFAGKYKDDMLRFLVTSDVHSPDHFRVNGTLRNIDAWYRAFDIEPGDKMYTPPEARTRIW